MDGTLYWINVMAGRTGRQKALGIFYPWLMRLTKVFGKNIKRIENQAGVRPRQEFYALTLQRNDGTAVPLSEFKGKKILVVNTASDCGYTPQYKELQELYAHHKDRLVVIGF